MSRSGLIPGHFFTTALGWEDKFVIWILTLRVHIPCYGGGIKQCFGRASCLHLHFYPEDGGSSFLRNTA